MTTTSLTHLSDRSLLQVLVARVSREQTSTAEVIDCIAEVDARKLYLGEGYSSMFVYCTRRLHLSDQSAYRRINCARVSRRFPEVFAAIADGRLHLCGALALAPYLTETNASGLIAAATHKSRSEIEVLVAERFPKPDVPTVLRALPALELSPSATLELSPVRVCQIIDPEIGNPGCQAPSPAHVAPVLGPSRVKPLSPDRYALQTTIMKQTRERLERAQELLGLRKGDIAQVIDCASIALLEKLEKRKCAATDRPRPCTSEPEAGKRYIAADVKRAVLKRDSGRCTFVSQNGHRCQSRRQLQFDHIQEFARGGLPTLENLRLRCRAHNLYGAERAYGREFMARKRSHQPLQSPDSQAEIEARSRMLLRRRITPNGSQPPPGP